MPDEEWNDFVITVLGWWLDEAINAIESTNLCLRFMDGPFRVLLDKQNTEDLYQLSVVDQRKLSHGCTSVLGGVTGREFLRELLQCAGAVLRACMAKKWESTELSLMKDRYDRLRRSYQQKYRGVDRHQ